MAISIDTKKKRKQNKDNSEGSIKTAKDYQIKEAYL